MQVTHTVHEQDGEGIVTRQTITIEIEPGDDPSGLINGLVVRDRLRSFLRLYGQGADVQVTSETDLRHLLLDVAFVAEVFDTRVAGLLWMARDTLGMSWRELERQTEIPAATIRRRVAEERARSTESGWWRDAAGIHRADPETAAQRSMARVAELDNRGRRRPSRLDSE